MNEEYKKRVSQFMACRRVAVAGYSSQGSYVEGAEEYAAGNNISLIPAGCPLMFVSPDFAHRCMKWFFSWRGLLEVEEEPSCS